MQKFIIILSLFFFSIGLKGQLKTNFFLEAEIVSTYVWRGSYLSGASLQPAMGAEIGGLTLFFNGSSEFSGYNYREINFTIEYSIRNFTFGFNDYWGADDYITDYFDFRETSLHQLEAFAAYKMPVIDLNITWNTFIAGDDKYFDKNSNEKRAFSTYVEAEYEFTYAALDFNLFAGASLWKSDVKYTAIQKEAPQKFAVVNVGFDIQKKFEINKKFSLIFFRRLIANPANKDMFVVCGIGF